MNPQEEFLHFLKEFPALTEVEKTNLAAIVQVKKFVKGTLLLQQGNWCTDCYFVLKGCVRQFSETNAEEKTTAFYVERDAVVLFNYYNQPKPSDYSLVCVEDCILIVGNAQSEEKTYQQFPKLIDITRGMMAEGFGKTQEALSRFMTSSPEERYVHLVETKSTLLQRVPLHQLASYLGVTPESLSRIRKRIVKK